VTSPAAVDPPSAEELAEKLTELVNVERGIVALYYYLPDEMLAQIAQALCQAHRSQNMLHPGVEPELHSKEAGLDSWTAASAIWYSEAWQPAEVLATFGFRIIEGLRAQHELWRVIIDPQAQFFALATAKDAQHRYWFVLVTGRKIEAAGVDSAIAAR
jgi:hypothetical protein